MGVFILWEKIKWEKNVIITPFMRKYSIIEGILEIFCKENHFSEEKSPELSQVGRPSTAHPCRGWMGGFEQQRKQL
jgi:hypothetical protein